MKNLHAGIVAVLAAVILPRPDLQVWEWLRKIGYKVKGQLYNIAAAPYLEEPFRAARDATVRKITMPCPVQSGKSTFIQGLILFFLGVERANICYYSQDDPGVGEFSETRMIPDFEKYLKSIKHPDRNKTKKHLIISVLGNWVAMLAGNNKNNRNSRSARISINDEFALLEAGATEECGKRTNAYKKTNGLHIEIGTPENSGVIDKQGRFQASDAYASWKQSTMHIWHVECPGCKGITPLSNKLYRFDTNETTKPGGKINDEGKYEGGEYDFSALRESIRWQCECGHRIECDSPEYRDMQDTGHYVQTNHKAESKNRGYHYSGFAVRWIDPKDLVISFVQATEIAKRGLHEKLNQVITKDFGEFWHPRQTSLQERKTHVTGGYHLGDSDWEHELIVDGIRRRTLTADVQKDHFYVGVRMWGAGGISKLLHVQRATHWQDIKDIQKKFDVYEGVRTGRVWTPGRVFIDAAWGRYQKHKGDSEVHRHCAKHNWWAIRGQDTNKFRVSMNGRIIERYYSDITPISIGGSLGCKSFSFANPVICGHLDELKAQNGPSWELPDDVPRWYLDQIDNKQPVPRPDGKGLIWEQIGPDHCYDMEKMQLPQAYADKLFAVSTD
ncbi:phage terminase large subunit family protein [bacterium]|nr:phage terminase large subunit family protein [bacterium]